MKYSRVPNKRLPTALLANVQTPLKHFFKSPRFIRLPFSLFGTQRDYGNLASHKKNFFVNKIAT